MMIIRVGKVEEITKDIICGKCKSELRYELKDIQSDRDGRYIICPVCGQFLSIDKT